MKREGKIPHAPGAPAALLARRTMGSPLSVKTVGNWYWIVEEIERAGCLPRLVHAAKANFMLGMVKKTDELYARGLKKLQRTGTLPTMWIPPGELRDKRELIRTRMLLVRQRTELKGVWTRPWPSTCSGSPRSRTCSGFREERSCGRS